MEEAFKTGTQSLDPDQGCFSMIDASSQQEAPSPKLSVTELSKELESKSELVSCRYILLFAEQILFENNSAFFTAFFLGGEGISIMLSFILQYVICSYCVHKCS